VVPLGVLNPKQWKKKGLEDTTHLQIQVFFPHTFNNRVEKMFIFVTEDCIHPVVPEKQLNVKLGQKD